MVHFKLCWIYSIYACILSYVGSPRQKQATCRQCIHHLIIYIPTCSRYQISLNLISRLHPEIASGQLHHRAPPQPSHHSHSRLGPAKYLLDGPQRHCACQTQVRLRICQNLMNSVSHRCSVSSYGQPIS